MIWQACEKINVHFLSSLCKIVRHLIYVTYSNIISSFDAIYFRFPRNRKKRKRKKDLNETTIQKLSC